MFTLYTSDENAASWLDDGEKNCRILFFTKIIFSSIFKITSHYTQLFEFMLSHDTFIIRCILFTFFPQRFLHFTLMLFYIPIHFSLDRKECGRRFKIEIHFMACCLFWEISFFSTFFWTREMFIITCPLRLAELHLPLLALIFRYFFISIYVYFCSKWTFFRPIFSFLSYFFPK